MSSPQVTWDDETTAGPQIKWDDEVRPDFAKNPPGVPRPTVDMKEHYLIGGEEKEPLGSQIGNMASGMAKSAYQISAPGIASSLSGGKVPSPVQPTPVKQLPNQIMTNALPMMAGADELPYTEAGPEAAAEGAAKASDLGLKAKAVGKLAAKDVVSHVPFVGRVVRRPSFADYVDAARTKAPVPEETPTPPPKIGLPPQEELNAWWRARGGKFYGEPIQQYGVKAPLQAHPNTEPIPSGIKIEPQAAPPIPVDTSPKRVGSLLEEGTGAKPLQPNVPLREQFKMGGPSEPSVPAGHTKASSSAIQSYRYDPEARELHVTAKDGITHVYGEVSEDQAQSFMNASSKGKAWKDIRDNNVKVAKISPEGVRTANKGATEFKSASPEIAGPQEDLTSQLKRSVEAVRQKKAKAAVK